MSQIKIRIQQEDWCETPAWVYAWEKMIDYLDYEENIDNYGNVSCKALRRELKKVGARWLELSETMVFPNEKSYAFWLLKWS